MTDVHAMVTELTRTHVVGTPYTTYHNGELHQAWHYVKAPALLVQLQHATPSSNGEAAGTAGFGSRPAARIEALDTLMHIDREASAWVRNLGDDDPGSTAGCVLRVGALYRSATEPDQKQLHRAIRSWWNQARITTGYDSPAWRPDNTCPLCAEQGTLRVKLATHSAMCISCREGWTAETIGLLADHILAENGEAQEELPNEGDAA